MFAFMIAQGVYLSRHMKPEPESAPAPGPHP